MICAAALLAFCGCSDNDDEIDKPTPSVDKISVAPTSETFDCDGGKTDVIVTSSGEWTLAGEFDWVRPLAREGEDGDLVTFEIDANTSKEELTAEFTFTVGEASDTFTVILKADDGRNDKISVFPERIESESEGGKFSATVTSSGAWTLEGESDWVSPSIREGEDGDAVEFTVLPNDTQEEKSAEFTFATGTKKLTYKIVAKATEYVLELQSEAEVEIGEEGGQIEVLLNSTDNYRDLSHTVASEAQSWLHHTMTLAGEGEKGAKMYFDVDPNTTWEGRTGVIEIKGTHETPTIRVTVGQAQQDNISTDNTEFIMGLEGGELSIPITANVEYDIEYPEWITYNGKQGETERFMVTGSSSRREGKIVFTGGKARLEVNVLQRTQALVEWVALMADNCAWPAWDNPSPVNNLTQFTMEATVNFPDYDAFKTSKEISTIMGIEGKFLLRLGDGQSVYSTTPEVAHAGGAVVASSSLVPMFHMDKWLQIAVTFDRGNVTLYLDGTEIGSGRISAYSMSFGQPHTGKETDSKKFFWVGYSYAEGRDFKGLLSEVRIWNKVLTTSDFKAENHKYYVDPDSEGLVAYWRFNEGEGSVIKDYSKSGNDMQTKTAVQWKSVSLP